MLGCLEVSGGPVCLSLQEHGGKIVSGDQIGCTQHVDRVCWPLLGDETARARQPRRDIHPIEGERCGEMTIGVVERAGANQQVALQLLRVRFGEIRCVGVHLQLRRRQLNGGQLHQVDVLAEGTLQRPQVVAEHTSEGGVRAFTCLHACHE